VVFIGISRIFGGFPQRFIKAQSFDLNERAMDKCQQLEPLSFNGFLGW